MQNKLKSLMKKSKKAEGFTLIEMVVVIAIIAILILLVVPNLGKQKDKANERTNEAFKTTLQTQVELSEKKSITKWDELSDLLSEKQIKRAEEEGYTVKDGIVQGPSKKN